ncbi:hypothetical protein [Henriciella sp.]|uniref:hypothetical protein n=1 Tax=Henriciella sp. TaxID=1968823 RepID=UPI002632BCAF|nr:hypothetical protein [Henriciella sp.]
MLHPSTQKLIDRLAAMTAQKKIDWIEKDNGDVLYATEGYVVRLTPEPARVLLSTDNGKALEDATSTVLNATAHPDGGTYGDLVAVIARDACREARGTEAAINTLLAGLSEPETEASPAEETETVEESSSAEEAAASEDTLEEADIPVGPDAVEDPGDDTTALTAATPDPADETVDNPWSTPSSDEAAASAAVEETLEGPDTPDDDLVDASVPEAALVEEISDADEDASAASSEADAEEITSNASDTDETEEDNDSEAFVGGAVARLADEVNAHPADPSEPEAISEPELSETPEEPAEGLGADDAAGTVEAEAEDVAQAAEDTDEGADESDDTYFEEAESFSPTPSYSVAPDDAPVLDDEPDAIAPEAAAPVPGDEADDFGAADDLEDEAGLTDEPEAVSAEVSAEAVVEETAEAATDHETVTSEPQEDEVASVAPVWDAAPGDVSSETESDEADHDSVETWPAATETPVVADSTAEADDTPEPVSAADTNVHYIPFGAGGLQAEGAEVSAEEVNETPENDSETDSGLATAATMMAMPEDVARTETDASDEQAESDDALEESALSTETSFDGDEWSPENEAPAETEAETSDTSEPLSAPFEREATTAPEPSPPGAISLSGLGAGLGFGQTASGFQPTAPKPAGTPEPRETVSRAPVYIDATDDYSGETGVAAESNAIPDITDLDRAEDYVEASVSDADLDAVSPRETQTVEPPQEPDRSLSLVESEGNNDQRSDAEEAPRPTRPKTRFNPWT